MNIETYDFSYAATLSRQTGKNRMRFRAPDGTEYLCDEIVSGVGGEGPCAYVFGEGPPNHLQIRCGLQVIDGIAYLYPPDDIDEDPYEPVEELPESHYRICARLSNKDWRWRNERTGELRHVNGVKGWINANWLDKGSHIFHDGPAVIDTEGYVRMFA